MNTMIKKIQNSTFDIRPEWRVSPAPSIKHGVPVVSDNLIDNFSSGAVKSVVGIKGAVGADQIELTDGSIVEVDAIIWCTGYKGGFSILDPSADPTRNTTPFWDTLPGSKGKPLPRLYQNIISLDYPQTLAFMGYVAYATGAFPLYDIASMALAQTWAGKSQVPTTIDMTRWVDRQHEFICNIAKHGSVIPGWVREGEWMAWANAAAGTGVDEYLGWGWKGWMFWLREGSLYKLLMDGVYSPHIYRVFEGGKRKAWDGALAEIERVNQALIEKRNK